MEGDVYQQALADLAQARKFISSALSAMEQGEVPQSTPAEGVAQPADRGRASDHVDVRDGIPSSQKEVDTLTAAAIYEDATKLLLPTSPDGLTSREREVLILVASGLPNRNIARDLGISEKTVKNHLAAVFVKLGVSDRTQAALYALRCGLVAR